VVAEREQDVRHTLSGMPFDIDEIDRLLTTTRTVRRHLDLERDVPQDVLLRCIDIAEQAPSGSNQASRRWLIVRDPETKLGIAELYREVGAGLLTRMAETPAGQASTGQRVFGSAAHLARNLERVPVLVLLAIHGVHDGSGRPSLFDSVIQSGWSFCLAARARGLGTAWTTIHLGRADEAARLLGIPPGVSQIALFAVAYATKDDFSPVERRPAAEITYVDQWGFTPDRRGVVVERDLAAGPDRVWDLVTDIGAPGRYSGENRGGEWTSDAPYGIGSTFLGANATDDTGHPAINELLIARLGRLEWETPCTVVAWEPGVEFAYEVGPAENRWARWGFTLQPLLDGRTRVGHYLRLLDGVSGTTRAMAEHPEQADAILTGRLRTVRSRLAATLEGIRSEAEPGLHV
jgi:nitroreductase